MTSLWEQLLKRASHHAILVVRVDKAVLSSMGYAVTAYFDDHVQKRAYFPDWRELCDVIERSLRTGKHSRFAAMHRLNLQCVTYEDAMSHDSVKAIVRQYQVQLVVKGEN